MRYAAEQGYRNITLYVDNGASGIDFNRPAFSKMTSDIAAGKVNVVVVKSFDRIGRNAIGVMGWMDALKRRGIAVKSLDCTYEDSFRSIDELIRRTFAELNRKKKKTNQRTVRRRPQMTGVYKYGPQKQKKS